MPRSGATRTNRCIYHNTTRCKRSVWSADGQFCYTHSLKNNLHYKEFRPTERKTIIVYVDDLLNDRDKIEYGTCLECGNLCNVSSQWCGRCARGGIH